MSSYRLPSESGFPFSFLDLSYLLLFILYTLSSPHLPTCFLTSYLFSFTLAYSHLLSSRQFTSCLSYITPFYSHLLHCCFLTSYYFSSDSPSPLAILPPTFSPTNSLLLYLCILTSNHTSLLVTPLHFAFFPFHLHTLHFTPLSLSYLIPFLFHIHFSRFAFLPLTFPHSPSLIPPAPFAFLTLTVPPLNSLPLPIRYFLTHTFPPSASLIPLLISLS
ncbi:unnamed protein product [Acanthosepion pharaonis]|uniref:Uncharacterized protein n=1 Tax=Acanthosepion pharaonis TaxID=158019 RepID=A0A812AQY8_ACAPH|nr:unnamed protein product [Sepia pharaonis]